MADESCHHATPRPGVEAAITGGTPQPPPLCEDPLQGGHRRGAQGMLPPREEEPQGERVGVSPEQTGSQGPAGQSSCGGGT